jgi:hypothetical protein
MVRDDMTLLEGSGGRPAGKVLLAGRRLASGRVVSQYAPGIRQAEPDDDGTAR